MRRRSDPAAPGPTSASAWAEGFEVEALSHIDSLYRTALRSTRDAADADDLVQDTYLKAFRAAGQFEAGTNLRAWLFTILHNTMRNRARDRSREPVVIDSEAVERAAEAPGIGDTPESLLLDDTLDADLQAAVDALPDGVPAGDLVTRRGRVFVRRNRRHAGDSGRDRDVAHLARPPDAV